MTRHVLLNNIAHKDLRVITRYSKEFGDEVHAVPTFPTEFADVQREYPVMIRRDAANGKYHAVALLGFAEGENLYLDDGEWHARYVPAMLARGPFLIGFQQQEIDGEQRREPVIHVDLDDPRVSDSEGEPVFLPHGGHTAYLERIAKILRGMQEGIAISDEMFAAFDREGLIEAVDLQIDFHTDQQSIVTGFHTISQDRLNQLEGTSLERLNSRGFLHGAFMILSSLANMKYLIDAKNRRDRKDRA